MTGIIVSIPPTVELPPGNNSGSTVTLPGVTYTYAVLTVPQTWTALQTYNLNCFTLNGTGGASQVLRQSSLNAPVTVGQLAFSDISGALPFTIGRTRLTANTDFFVRTDGNDSNTGLSNTAGGAFLTIGAALANVTTNYDLNRKLVQIRVQGGTYTENVFLPQWLGFDSINGFSQLKIIGENGTVTWTSSSATACVFGTKTGPPVTIENITFTNPAASGILVYMDDFGFVSLKTCVLGATGAGGIKANSVLESNILLQNSTFQIAGNSGILFNMQNKGAITCQPGCVFNASGAVTYSTAVVNVDATSIFVNGTTSFTGTIPTGVKYILTAPGKITDTTTIAGSIAATFTPLAVTDGGTGQASWTSGGIPYANTATTIASTAALSANAILLGGGAGGAPTNIGSLGTTTTVLHGNASGAPTFGAVALAADVSGTLPVANGGTNYTGIAFSAFTPTITAGAGTLTTVSATGRQLTIGKMVFFEMNILITTNGTGSAFLSATLPSNAVTNYIVIGKQNTSNKSCQGQTASGSNSLTIQYYDGTYPGADGVVIIMSGYYEAA